MRMFRLVLPLLGMSVALSGCARVQNYRSHYMVNLEEKAPPNASTVPDYELVEVQEPSKFRRIKYKRTRRSYHIKSDAALDKALEKKVSAKALQNLKGKQKGTSPPSLLELYMTPDGVLAAGERCAVSMQLFYQVEDREDSLRSNPVCVQVVGETGLKAFRADDFVLFNITPNDSKVRIFRRRHLCQESDRTGLCTWNGGFREAWPLSVRFESHEKGVDISDALGAVRVYLNGELRHHEIIEEGTQEYVLEGQHLIADYMPHEAPLSIRLMPSAVARAQREFDKEKNYFESRRADALSVIEGTLKSYAKESDDDLLKNSQCMAIHARLVYALTKSATTGTAVDDFADLKSKWKDCKESEYAKKLEKHQQCWDVDSAFAASTLDTSAFLTAQKASAIKAAAGTQGLLTAKPLTIKDLQAIEPVTQKQAFAQMLAEIQCAEKTALLTIHEQLLGYVGVPMKDAAVAAATAAATAAVKKAVGGKEGEDAKSEDIDLKGKVEVLVANSALPLQIKVIVRNQFANTMATFKDESLTPSEKARVLEVFHQQLLELSPLIPTTAREPYEALVAALGDLSDKVAAAANAYKQIVQIASEVDSGVKAMTTLFVDLEGQVKELVTNEEEALLLYNSFAGELPDQNDFFVGRKQNPAPSPKTSWVMDSKHLDPSQFFTLVTWNAVPFALQGTAYVEPIDVSTAIPIVDIVGYRHLYNSWADVRGALGIVVYQEQLRIELRDSEDFEFSYVNPGIVMSLGIRSFRVGAAVVACNPTSRRFTQRDEYDKIITRDDAIGDTFKIDEDTAFGPSGLRNIRIFVGVDLLKLFTNQSTGFSASTGDQSSN